MKFEIPKKEGPVSHWGLAGPVKKVSLLYYFNQSHVTGPLVLAKFDQPSHVTPTLDEGLQQV